MRCPRVLTALHVPADPREALHVLEVADDSTAISDRLGGVLLDDPVVFRAPDSRLVCVYLPEAVGVLRLNARLATICARLGAPAACLGLRGDALLLGTGDDGVDTDVRAPVLDAARRCGYAVAVAPRDDRYRTAGAGALATG